MTSLDDKIKYNKSSADDFGWSPEWFGLAIDQFDQKLIEIIEEFQTGYDLEADGMVGPSTFRRLYAYISLEQAEKDQIQIESTIDNYIYYNGVPQKIMWSKVVNWFDEGGLTCKSRKSSVKKTMFINHWDVCVNSRQMARVLKARSLGVHFAIDYDGCIYGLCDMSEIAYHAAGHNSHAIGVEICNPYALHYQDYYKKTPFGERPVITNDYVHGKKLKPHLGFYKHQLDALAALWSAVSLSTGIPLQVPNNPDRVDHFVASGSYTGFVKHLNTTRRKIDPGGQKSLDMHEIQEKAILIKLAMQKNRL